MVTDSAKALGDAGKERGMVVVDGADLAVYGLRGGNDPAAEGVGQPLMPQADPQLRQVQLAQHLVADAKIADPVRPPRAWGDHHTVDGQGAD